ncbi:MAG TPA: CDGSH iron-sulfur domain-containing protein [Burkholderiales bacterium]|jgi:CDGSH-type Zn-finger protein|nr:CDGSH iron-sulfur domain-containing protein [Burkholderiales bacterium]
MPNLLQPQIDGPLKVQGEIEILAADGTLLRKTAEAWLCRCGGSSSKPFCDGTHAKAGFREAARVGSYQPKTLEPVAPGTGLRISLRTNGPLRCVGEMRIEGADNSTWSGTQASLCRCGGSKNKPFCDGTHRNIGFEAA